MINCKITKCLDFNAYQIQYGNKECVLVMEFYGIDTPKIGDELQMSEILLDKNWKNYAQPYAFEKIAINPMNVEKLDNSDLIVLKTKEDIFALMRVYG